MGNDIKAMEVFEQFATGRLGNHIAELNTRYENKKIDTETMQQAYRNHQEIFSQELDEKVQSILTAENNSRLKTELGNLKQTYLSKLNLKQSV